MHAYTRMHTSFPIALSCVLTLLTGALAQDEPPLPYCQTEVGPSGIPVCCDSTISGGPDVPCPGGQLVDDIANCTTELSPTGWACCVETVSHSSVKILPSRYA
jgi:hypothetical protein